MRTYSYAKKNATVQLKRRVDFLLRFHNLTTRTRKKCQQVFFTSFDKSSKLMLEEEKYLNRMYYTFGLVINSEKLKQNISIAYEFPLSIFLK